MARENVSNGSRGKDAFDAQRALNKFHIQSLMGNGPGLSRAPLREDSIFGSDSTAALNGFKDAVGLPTDGTADNDTWSELEKFVPEDIAAQDALYSYGVPSATVIQAFNPGGHGGVDVSPQGVGAGDVSDPRRGVPVYLMLKPTISREELNGVRRYDGQVGLGFQDGSNAILSELIVVPQPWPVPGTPQSDAEYGGIIGVAARYQYDDGLGPQIFTVYVEYEHLITPEYPPKNSAGTVATLQEYGSTAKGIGFGSLMVNGRSISPSEIDSFVMAGFLGATQTPHVHIQSRYKTGVWGYLGQGTPLIDPTLTVEPLHDLEIVTPGPP